MFCLCAFFFLLPALSYSAPDATAAHTITEGPLTVIVDGADEPNWEAIKPMLKDQLTLSGNTAPTEPLADDLAFFTRQHYVREGWPAAAVKWEIQKDGIHLTVASGERIRVGEITWKGDLILPEDELKKFLLRPSIEKEDADKKLPTWVDADLKSGASLVERRLRAEGYLNAEATLLPAPEAKDNRRDLTMEIKPGPRFVFGDVALRDAPAELEKLMRDQIEKTTGSPFNEASVQALQSKLKTIAFERGYIQAEVLADYQMGTKGGSVDVTLRVKAGGRAKIARVTPHPGFSKGAQRVLAADFRPAVGKYFSAEEVDFYFRRALDTQMFARLDDDLVVLAPDGDGSQVEMKLSGEETKPHTLGFEIGFDTFLGPQAGVTYRNTNFRDSGNTLAAALNWSTAGPLGFVQFTNPAIFGSQYSSSVKLAVENFGLFEYSRYGTSLNFEVTRRVNRAFSYSGFLGMSANTVSTDILTPEELGPEDYGLASAGLSTMLDYRDSPVLTKKGWFVSARIESSLDVAGSNVSFLRSDLRGAWYRPITKKFRFATGAALMSIQGAAAEDLPIDTRVFNGGPNTVRAFAERELGPVTPGGTPLGGTSAVVGSAEFSYEVYPNLEFAVFSDIGSLGRQNNGSPFDYSSDFRSAVGAGLRYHLPFGPIRIDYGHNVSPREGESNGELHVTVGFAF
ncbi:MAG: BamA/TamA family outer membrane protein [Verrucomicrobiaceae bacterium]|nr:BamA/TamA family outer membrane protein [Verrucomicrobiaceae bacterium]